jgi:hypothetical protein
MRLFAWQRAIIASTMPLELRMTALRVGLDSAGGTGLEVVVNDASVAVDVGCSTRTVWRRVQQLVELGWLVQISRPTHRGRAQAGRRASYALVLPTNSSDGARRDLADDGTESSATDDRPMSGDYTKSSATQHRTMSDDTAESSDTAPPESFATDRRTGGTHSSRTKQHAAAAARTTADLPVPVQILAGKLNAAHPRLAPLIWTQLGPEREAQIVDLVELHGDRRLVDVALSTLRDPAPTTAQAFLGTWLSLPPPGQVLALAPKYCPTHNVKLTPSGVCNSCAADQKAIQ